jgi:OmpA-OmpF porin, OOP family
MTTNLLESIAGQLTPNMIQHVSTVMGETAAHTQKAVDGAILTLLAGLLHLSSSGEGPARLVNLINHRNYGPLLNNMTGLLDDGNTAQTMIASGQDILSTLFTDKRSAVGALIADASGVTSASASSLLSLTAPVVVGVVARARTAEGLNADGLTTLLIARKDDISRLAPAGLAGVFGLSGIAELGASRADTATGNAPNEQLWAAWEQRGKDSGRPPWGWLLLGIAALSLVYWLWGRETEVTPRRVSTPPQMSTLALELLPPIPTVGLPDGTVLSLTTTGYGQENLLATNEAGDRRATNHHLGLVEKK